MTNNKHKITTITSNKSLSILFNSGGFSFCISDGNRVPISFGEYPFEQPITNPEFLLSKIKNILENDKEIQQDFETIKVIHQNNLATLVPKPFFDKTQLNSYLSYNIKTLTNDYISYDYIDNVEAYNIYIPYVNINNYLFHNFGELEYKHHATVLIEKLIELTTTENISYYVNINKYCMDVVIIKNNKLILYNTFNYNSPEDFCYYILFVAEQLDININEFTLTFLGKISQGDIYYRMISKFVKNIEFINIKSSFFDDSETIENHNHFILIS